MRVTLPVLTPEWLTIFVSRSISSDSSHTQTLKLTASV